MPVVSAILPAKSVMRKAMLLDPESVTPFHEIDVPVTLVVISVQVIPPSTEPSKRSVANKAELKVPVIVCDAVWVLKSLADVPVSALRRKPFTVTVGAWLSYVKLKLVTWPELPALSTCLVATV